MQERGQRAADPRGDGVREHGTAAEQAKRGWGQRRDLKQGGGSRKALQPQRGRRWWQERVRDESVNVARQTPE